MEYTKYIARKLWIIVLGLVPLVSAVVIPLASNDNGGMISNYCNLGRPFLGFHLEAYELCGIWVTFGFIAMIAVGLLIIGFSGAVFADGVKWALARARTPVIRFFNRKRAAKLFLVPCIVENEIYVAVQNEELLMHAKDVYGYTKFAWNYDPIEGRIIWSDISATKGEINIPPKKYKTLHFATIDKNNGTLILHKIEGDNIFPLPDQQHPTYKFPLTMYGSMYFFRWKCKKVDIYIGRLIVVECNGKDINARIYGDN